MTFEYFSHRSTSVYFDDLLMQALRDGDEVRIVQDERGAATLEIDGTEVVSFPTESFTYPLDRVSPKSEDAEVVVDDLADRYRSYRTAVRNRQPKVDRHSAAEGYESAL